MMMMKKALAIAVLCGTSIAAQAVTIDLRHEYVDNGTNGDRALVSHRFDNGFGFAIEAKWKSTGENKDQPFTELMGSGHEDSIDYLWKANKNFSLTPGVAVESTDTFSNWKPFLKGQYNFDNGIYLAARYRFEYVHFSDSTSTPDDTINRGDLWAGYVFGDWRTELNYVYAQADKTLRANKKLYSEEYNLKVAYKCDKNWAPYAEIGNVSGSKNTEERQTRYRAGIAYSF